MENSIKLLIMGNCISAARIIPNTDDENQTEERVVAAGIDDQKYARMVLNITLNKIGVYTNSGKFIQGKNEEEINNFTKFIMSMKIKPTCIFLDQNLDSNGKPFKKGTELIRQLKKMKYEGCLIIRSSDNSPEDISEYLAAGAHGVIPKHIIDPAEFVSMMNQIMRKVKK